MRGFVVIACLLTVCCATPKPRGEFDDLFSERAHTAAQYQPYRPIDFELVPAKPLEPQPDVVEVMRYVVGPDTSSTTAPPPVVEAPADPQPTSDEGPWRPYGY